MLTNFLLDGLENYTMSRAEDFVKQELYNKFSRFHLYETVDAISLTHSPTHNIRTELYNSFLNLHFNSFERFTTKVKLVSLSSY